MDYDWKTAVRKAQTSSAGSSGQLSGAGSHNIKFWRDGDKWMFQFSDETVQDIKAWEDIPIDNIHFRPIGSAIYAKLNSHGETVVDELTKSIIRGDVKITGPHSCVNNLGMPPAPGCAEVEATVPVPIMWNEDVPIYTKLSMVKVKRGAMEWSMYPAHIEESTVSGEGREKMGKHRIYMCGAL